MPQFIRQRMKPASVRGLYSCLTAVFLSLLPASYDTAHRSNSLNISSMLDSVLKHYDKRVRPNYGGPAVEVGVTMYILGFSSVSEIDMDFTIDFYFRQFWSDERLMVASPEWDSQLSVGAEVINQIWIPDTFFVNEKKAYFHNATTPNSFLRIASDGAIIRSMRLTVTGACFMNLRYFPMDSQSCKLEIESFGYTALDVVYKWLKKQSPLGISPDVELSQFKLLGHRTGESEIKLSTGTYSRLACEFFFVRDMGYYLIQLYIPSGLIVIISWVSFWLNRNASPARVSLGVTTVLTMTTLMSSTNAALPKVSYVKSIDIYLGTCFVLVFAALIEYAAVGYLAKHLAQSRGLQPWQPTDELNIPELFETHQQYYGIFPRESAGTAEQFVQIPPRLQIREELPDPLFPNDYTISPSDIDKYSRIAFPVFFICFNLIYWIIYLHISKSNLSDDIVPLAPE